MNIFLYIYAERGEWVSKGISISSIYHLAWVTINMILHFSLSLYTSHLFKE